MPDELSKNQRRIFVECLKLTKMIFGEFLSTGTDEDRRMSGDRDQSSSNSKHVFPASMSFSASWQRTSIVARGEFATFFRKFHSGLLL
jgi:hypothetical protein